MPPGKIFNINKVSIYLSEKATATREYRFHEIV